jgi:hypothetical protein
LTGLRPIRGRSLLSYRSAGGGGGDVRRYGVELRALRDPAPEMTLRSAEDLRSSSGLEQDDPRLLKIASLSGMDLALLERRAKAEGFQV